MKKIAYVLGFISAVTYAAVPVPNINQQQHSWANGVNAASSMNSNNVGSLGLNKNTDVTSGLNSLSTQLGAGTVNIAKQAVDGNGQASSSVQGQYNGAKNDPNYLYNQGQAGLVQCRSQSDPACAAVTKYNDDSVRASLHQSNMGTNSFVYNTYVTPDPSNTTCSIIKSWEPVNQSTFTCISGVPQQSQCNNIITTYTEYVPPIPADGTILHPDVSPGACGSGVVSGSWIPQGDRAWFIITNYYNIFKGGTLPIILGATSGKTPCRLSSSKIITTPTASRVLIGNFYMDWLGGQRGDIAFYQEPGINCGVNDNTKICNINITLAWLNGSIFSSWSLKFNRPKAPENIPRYGYSKGCPDTN